jgi:putative holliday junction resolvase
MRVVAIDHGTARCGLAVSDASGTIVRPLPSASPDPAEIAQRVRDAEGESVVVGLPLSLDGTEGAQVQVVREFCEALGEQLEVPVETWDERLTTSMAAASRKAGAEADEDSLAAAHLLESWLEAHTDSAPGHRAGDVA